MPLIDIDQAELRLHHYIRGFYLSISPVSGENAALKIGGEWMTKATLTLYPDMSDHPGPIRRAQLVLEVGPHRIESEKISAKRAEEVLEAITRAFGDAIAQGKHGYGDIM